MGSEMCIRDSLHLDYKFLLDRLSGSFEQFDSHSGLHRQPHTMLALNEVGMFRACKPSDQTGRSSRRNAPDLHHHRKLALMQADMSLWHMGSGLLQQFHPHSTLHLRHRRMIALGEAGTFRAGRLFGSLAP